MQLYEDQIEALWDLLEYPNHKINFHANRATFVEFLRNIDEKFGGHLNLAAISTGTDDYQTEIEQYLQLARAALNTSNGKLAFNKQEYYQACEHLLQTLPVTTLRDLHAQDENQGILEKILNNTFTAYEWLTDLDILRFLKATETIDRIKITHFNASDIGTALHFAREAGLNKIGFILNRGALGLDPGMHWFGLVITVNDDGSISYEATESLNLTQEEKVAMRKVIEDGIHFEFSSIIKNNVKKYQAFPGAKIADGIVKAAVIQPDSYSCGYRATHAVLQDPVLCGKNPLAVKYASQPPTTIALVECFCETQFDAITVNAADNKQKLNGAIRLADPVQATTQTKKELGKAVQERLDKYQNSDHVIVFPGAIDKKDKITADDCFHYFAAIRSKLKSNNKKLSTVNLSPCSIEVLEGFTRFCNHYPDLPFKSLKMTLDKTIDDKNKLLFNLQTLLGVLADKPELRLSFAEQSPTNPCIEKKDWKQLVKFMLGRKMTAEVLLPDELVTTKLQRKLDIYISDCQIELAEKLSRRALLTTKDAIAESAIKKPEKREKRTRGKDMTAGIDIEMVQEKEQQQEVKVEATTEAATQSEMDKGKQGKKSVMSFKEFSEAVASHDFDIEETSYIYNKNLLRETFNSWFGHIEKAPKSTSLIDIQNQALCRTPQNETKLYENPDIAGGTEDACAMLFQHAAQFNQGVDFQHLPAGFVLIDDPQHHGKRILDYDAKLAVAAKPSALAVNCTVSKPLKPVPYIRLDKLKTMLAPELCEILEYLVETEDEYDRDLLRIICTYAPVLAMLPTDDQESILNVCYNTRKTKFKGYLLESYMEAIIKASTVQTGPHCVLPDKYGAHRTQALVTISQSLTKKDYQFTESKLNILRLIDNYQLRRRALEMLQIIQDRPSKRLALAIYSVYARKGDDGLDQLLTMLEGMRKSSSSKVFNLLFDTFFNNMLSFEPLLTEEYQQCYRIIDAFDDIQFSWWLMLSSKHCHKHAEDDLPSCIAAFQEFLRQIDKLGLKLYRVEDLHNADYLTKVSNMKTTLGHMLTVLEQTKLQDRESVWKTILKLPLAADSAILALATPGCTFVVPESSCVPVNFNSSTSSADDATIKKTRGYRSTLWSQRTGDNWHHIALNESNQFDGVGQDNDGWSLKGSAYCAFNPDSINFLKMNFYRHLSFCQHRLSLQFYRAALDKLQIRVAEIADVTAQGIIFSRMAAILVSATTYNMEVTGIPNEEETYQLWVNILNHVINAPIPEFVQKQRLAFVAAAKFGGFSSSREDVRNEIRNNITMHLFTFQSLPSLCEMEAVLATENSKMAKAGLTDIKSVSDAIGSRVEMIDKLLRVFGGDVLTFGRRFLDKDAETVNKYMDLCWYLYEIEKNKIHLDPNKYKNEISDDKAGIRNATKEGKLFMSLLSSFGINSEKDLLDCYNHLYNAMRIKGGNCEAIYIQFLESLQAKRLNEVKGRKLEPQDFKELVDSVASTFTKNAHLLDVDEKSLTYKPVEMQKTNQAKWKLIGKMLLQYFGDNISRARVEAIFSYANLNANITQKVDALFKDVIPKNEMHFLNNFIGKIAPSIMHNDNILDHLRAILVKIPKEHRKRFLKALTKDEIWSRWTASSFKEMNKLFQLMAAAPIDLSPDFFYISEQSASSDSENIIKAATIYLDTIVPILAHLKGLSRFEALPMATSLLLRESSELIGKPTAVTTPTIKFWMDVMQLLAKETPIEYNEIETLWQRKPDSASCEQLTALFNELRKLEMERRKERGIQKVAVEVKKATQKIVSFFRGLGGHVEPEPPSVDTTKSLIMLAMKEAHEKKDEEFQYKAVFIQLAERISNLNERFPLTKKELTQFIHCCMNMFHDDERCLLAAVWKKLDVVETISHEIKNEKAMRSLLFWYSNNIGSPQDLVDLIQSLPTKEVRSALLAVAAQLLDNGHKLNLDLIRSVRDRLYHDGKLNNDVLEQITKIYHQAPFPTLNKLITWLDHPKDEKYLAVMKDNITQHDIEPCKRDPSNGFYLQKAKEQNDLCIGINFTDKELEKMQTYANEVRNWDTKILLNVFHNFRNENHNKISALMEQIVAVTAELLYRAKAVPGDAPGEKDESYEINTTQYLAILALLKGADHTTAGIGTGEGKSRILMIVNAIQYAMGKTVDFCTSDVVLAKRDFLAAQSFYNLIGAESSLIYADSPFSTYKMKGINYSDSSNISLFRNRAYCLGLDDSVIESDRRLRALTLDEADKPYYDMSDTRFNYSAESDESMENMEWIYTALIKFFLKAKEEDNNVLARNKVLNDYYEDVDACTDSFMDYVRINCTPEQYASMEKLSRSQLETYQTSAFTALALSYKVHYNVKGDVLLNTPKGPIMASDTRLIVHTREVLGARFSDGVHQCLTAYLNILREHPTDTDLCRDIARFQNDFHMDPEKRIIYSSSAQDFLDDYDQGSLRAVTGTLGVSIELQEAKQTVAHASHDKPEKSEMNFISMPRHKGLKRNDKPVLLTENEEGHNKEIIEAVKKALRDGQPILLICKDDTESEALYELLNKTKFFTNTQPKLIQRVHSGAGDQEEEMVARAGEPLVVTVSTAMIGRGTDIHVKIDTAFEDVNTTIDETLDADAKAARELELKSEKLMKEWVGVDQEMGLKIVCTYLPTTRELEQIFGRSGRAGLEGDAQLILNKQKLPPGFLIDDDDDDESKIVMLQIWLDRKNQCKRLIMTNYSRFRRQLNVAYFTAMGSKGVNSAWTRFDTQASQSFKITMSLLRDEINKEHPDAALMQHQLMEYRNKVALYWEELCNNIQAEFPAVKLSKNIGTLALDEHTKSLLLNFDITETLAPIQVKKILKLVDTHDREHDGFALLIKYLRLNDNWRNAINKYIASTKGSKQYNEKMQLLDLMCQSDKPDMLSRLLDAYGKLPNKSEATAKIVIVTIRRIIEETDWKPGVLGYKIPSGSCRSKLPKTIFDIYRLIDTNDKAVDKDYRGCFTAICSLCSNYKIKYTPATFQKLSDADKFYATLKEANDVILKAELILK